MQYQPSASRPQASGLNERVTVPGFKFSSPDGEIGPLQKNGPTQTKQDPEATASPAVGVHLMGSGMVNVGRHWAMVVNMNVGPGYSPATGYY